MPELLAHVRTGGGGSSVYRIGALIALRAFIEGCPADALLALERDDMDMTPDNTIKKDGENRKKSRTFVRMFIDAMGAPSYKDELVGNGNILVVAAVAACFTALVEKMSGLQSAPSSLQDYEEEVFEVLALVVEMASVWSLAAGGNDKMPGWTDLKTNVRWRHVLIKSQSKTFSSSIVKDGRLYRSTRWRLNHNYFLHCINVSLLCTSLASLSCALQALMCGLAWRFGNACSCCQFEICDCGWVWSRRIVCGCIQ